MIKKIIFLSVALFFIGSASFYVLISQKNNSESPVLFEVKQGSSLNAIANKLYKQDLISSTLLFKVYVRLLNKTTALKAGEFTIPDKQSIQEIVSVLMDGRSKQYSFAIIEGSTIKDVLKKINAVDNIEKTNDLNNFSTLINKIGAKEQHPEGLLLADTYYYSKGTTATKILQRSYKSMQAFLDDAWQKRDQTSPIKTPYEALILASIIEKETGVSSEREKIAGVFVNRLRRGMRLQTDPTVIYGLGDAYDGDIKYKDLRTDTPYNTYTRHGLPPTPIAMPGKAAIIAALNPETTDALFFVANGEGGHTFTSTLKDHEAAVKVYLQKTR